jgi:hypothetical protein
MSEENATGGNQDMDGGHGDVHFLIASWVLRSPNGSSVVSSYYLRTKTVGLRAPSFGHPRSGRDGLMMKGSYADERRRARRQMRGEQSDVDDDRGMGGPWLLLGELLPVAALVVVVLAGVWLVCGRTRPRLRAPKGEPTAADVLRRR